MPDYAVGMKFHAKDNLTSALNRMSDAVDAFSRKSIAADVGMKRIGRSAHDTASSFRNATKEGYKFGTIVKGIMAASAIRGGLGMISNGVRTATTNFLEFDDTMVSAASKFDDITMSAGNFGAQLGQLKKDWRDVARGTRYSAVEAGKLAETFAEAGWRSAAAKNSAPYLIKAAVANREKDLGEFASSVIGVFQGFNMKTGDPFKDAERFNTLLDKMTQASVDALGGITELKESMKVLGPTWGTSETPGAALAFSTILQNAGFSGEMIGTAGKNLKQRLADPLIAKTLKANGINIEDLSTGKIKTSGDLLKEISESFKTNGIKPGSAQELAIGKYLFGSWGLAAIKNVMANLREYNKEVDRIENGSKGVAGRIHDIVMEHSTLSKLLVLSGVAGDKFFEVFEAFNTSGKKGIDGLIETVKNFDTKELIRGLRITVDTLSLMWSVISPFAPLLPYIAQGFLAWKMVMAGFTLINFVSGLGVMNGGLAMMNLQLTGIVVAFGTIAIAMLAVFAIWEAGKSAFTGKDNFFSKMAQDAGLVPKLSYDANGRVNGYASDNQSSAPAPNSKEAEARRVEFYGLLNIASAPPGSTVSSHTQGAPNISMRLLGMAQ
jgi:TP901 family phage tail tape measure protein